MDKETLEKIEKHLQVIASILIIQYNKNQEEKGISGLENKTKSDLLHKVYEYVDDQFP